MQQLPEFVQAKSPCLSINAPSSPHTPYTLLNKKMTITLKPHKHHFNKILKCDTLLREKGILDIREKTTNCPHSVQYRK